MPIYEYECTGCGHRFELRQGFHDDPVECCPLCKGRSRRGINSVPLVFKGSGFYVNDYRKDGGRDYSGDKGEPKAGAEAKPGGKTSETKATTEPKPNGKEGDKAKSEAKA